MIEEWRSIKGYEDCYDVSNLGNVKSKERIVNSGNGAHRLIKERILKTAKGHNGYYLVTFKGKTQRVNRLVAQAFPEICGEWFDECQVEHINCDKTDNRAINLRCCTCKDNANNPITKERKSKSHNGIEPWNKGFHWKMENNKRIYF